MNLPDCTAKVNSIQELSDKPNEMDGLTPNQLKAKFDTAGTQIKQYINSSLIPAIESGVSGFISGSDYRLSNSRQCNNNFDNSLSARANLKIKSGTSLPGTVEEDCLFFLYS